MLYSSTIEQIERDSDSEFFLLTIRAVPNSRNLNDDKGEEIDAVGGAYVSCYINADSLYEAEQMAIDLIRESDWQPTMFLSWKIFCEECYPDPDDPDFVELSIYMAEAFSFGHSMVFDQWSEKDQEGEEIDECWEINFSYCKN